MSDKEFFHETVDAEAFEKMKAAGMTWQDINQKYKQPDWCTYPDALDTLGCWGLTGCNACAEYCKDCEMNSTVEQPTKEESK